jgi:hypothetical protein
MSYKSKIVFSPEKYLNLFSRVSPLKKNCGKLPEVFISINGSEYFFRRFVRLQSSSSVAENQTSLFKNLKLLRIHGQELHSFFVDTFYALCFLQLFEQIRKQHTILRFSIPTLSDGKKMFLFKLALFQTLKANAHDTSKNKLIPFL